ncbi:MAG: zinc-ribbon domain-containing protein [Terriglobales bacterium]
MTVRCNQCGHENNPEYRFCGMCGAPLLAAGATREPERSRVSPVGGPSFLGLGDDRSTDLDYLLDDEPPRGHGRLYLALLLLVMSGGLLAWHWQRDGYPWAGLIPKPTANSSPATSGAGPTPTSTSNAPAMPTGNATPPETQPAAGSPSGESPSAQPNQTATDQPSSAQAASAQPATAQPPARPGADGVTPPPTAAPGTKSVAGTSAPSNAPSPGDDMAKPSSPSSQDAGETDANDSSATKEAPAPATAKTAVVPARKSAAAKPAPAIPAVTPENRLVDEGERYLYGRGVRADCALAQRDLLIGARQSNSKAQTLLGAMYATGHCVGRDLPTAYRWFAKALHGEPSNSRVQRDLEVLWKQMTPEERQLAMKLQ